MPRTRSENSSGDVQELYAEPSSAHSNESGATRLSVPVNVNVATLSGSEAAGPVRIRVSGATMSGPSSTNHSNSAGGSSTPPSGFVARTSNVCSPSSMLK